MKQRTQPSRKFRFALATASVQNISVPDLPARLRSRSTLQSVRVGKNETNRHTGAIHDIDLVEGIEGNVIVDVRSQTCAASLSAQFLFPCHVTVIGNPHVGGNGIPPMVTGTKVL